jgi:hypothetical protein
MIEVSIHHYIHQPSDAETQRKLDLILNALHLMEGTMGVELDELRAEVERNTSVDASAQTLIQRLADRIDSLADDPAQLRDLAAQLRTQNDALASAVTTNTDRAGGATGTGGAGTGGDTGAGTGGDTGTTGTDTGGTATGTTARTTSGVDSVRGPNPGR